MEKRPVVIEGTFKVVVRRFHTEMQKEKKNFFYCGEMPGQDTQNKTLVRVYERYFLYPNIVATVTVFFEELEEKKTSTGCCSWNIIDKLKIRTKKTRNNIQRLFYFITAIMMVTPYLKYWVKAFL